MTVRGETGLIKLRLYPSEVDKLIPASAEGQSTLFGHGVASVGLLFAPFHSSFCSWHVSCEAGSGYFRCKSRHRKEGTLNSEL